MAKKDNTKTILIIAGIAGGVYLLTRPAVKEKLQDAMTGYLPEFAIPPIDLNIPSLSIPGMEGVLASLKELVGGTCLGGDLDLTGGLLGGLDEIVSKVIGGGGGGSATGPAEHATWADVAYSMPTWTKAVLGVGATALAGYGGFQLVRAFSPTLRAIGIQAARGIGGAGTILKSLITRSIVPKVSGQVIKSVPVAAAGTAGRGISGALVGGILPALAFTGIIEGGWQIIRTIKGERNIGTTGVAPIDIFNLITGRMSFFPTEPIPYLLFPNVGTVEGSQAGLPAELGGSPASATSVAIMPSIVATKTTPEAYMPKAAFEFKPYSAAGGGAAVSKAQAQAVWAKVGEKAAESSRAWTW